MVDIEIFSMFMLGLLGTGHCIGMCGPLVLAFPARTGRIGAHLLYHTGRIAIYAGLGAVMGGIGAGLAETAAGSGPQYMQRLVAIQVAISLASALFLTWFGLVRIGIVSEPKWMSSATPMKIPGYGYILDSAMSKKNLFGTFLLGAIFGFLPCGLSYAAFARALTAGGVVRGALWVLAFGLGTVPGLLLIGTAASRFARRHARHFDILSGMLMIAMGVSVVARTI